MTRSVKASAIAQRTTSREGGREAAQALAAIAEPVDFELDREPSLSFLDGLVRGLRDAGRLDTVTLVTRSDLVLRHLGRFVAHDPTIEIWVRPGDGGRVRVGLPEEEPLTIEDAPMGDEVGLG